MSLRNLLQTLLGDNKVKEEIRFSMKPDSEGLNFILPAEEWEQCRAGRSVGPTMLQYVALKMLEEQGCAEQIAKGFCVPSDCAVAVDDESGTMLDLPPPFPGSFCVRVHSTTPRSDFAVQLVPVLQDGTELPIYEVKGPCLRFSSRELYLCSKAEWLAVKALREHEQLAPGERTEWRNLKLVGTLQAARKLGMNIDLAHFDRLRVVEAESVGVDAVVQTDGSLFLTPTFGTGADPEAIRKRLGQLSGTTMQDFGVIRVHEKIVVLDEKRLRAAHEILTNRVIPKAQVKLFLKAPSAFLDASLVDLDTGFSLRVRGVTVFRPAYFGATDESGISWFEQTVQGQEPVFPPEELTKLVEPEDLPQVLRQLEAARNSGATLMVWAGKTIDISDAAAVEKVLNHIGAKRDRPRSGDDEGTDRPNRDPETSVVDIALNDLDLVFGTPDPSILISQVAFKGPIDYSPLKRQPYPHQDKGIRWILGLAEQSLAPQRQEDCGALLADDMGLGKTYMTLIAIAEYFRLCAERKEEQRPVLVVVPLTLLETWQEEIVQTFGQSPFYDIVQLQANADLDRFRIRGAGVETRQGASAHASLPSEHETSIPEDAIRYSLKIGLGFKKEERLDLPGRLVLTTYQTLRDYQFSLCRVDWSFVVFDEAQNIKNPNALVTRAAKGLKARFKLLATGTPVENSLRDFWCLLDTAKPGLLGAYQDFRQEYITPITKAKPEEVNTVRQLKGLELRHKVGEFMLRRLKEEQLEGLPEKHIFSGLQEAQETGCQYLSMLESVMQGEQKTCYDQAIDAVAAKQLEGSAKNPVLAGLHQLRDISLHPLLLNGGLLDTPEDAREAQKTMALSGKLVMLCALLDDIRKRDEKVLLFLINKRLQSFLKVALERLYGIKVAIINGDTKALARTTRTAEKTRKGLIDTFSKEPGFGVLIMSPLAAGVGLTVVAANNVIHLERHWNPAKEDQATDRVYRIGQRKEVNIYLPALTHPDKASFDVNLHRLLAKKVTLKDAVITPEEVSSEEMGGLLFPSATDPKDQTRPLRGGDLVDLSWEEFEALCAELFARDYEGEAYLTPANDSGADVVVFSEKGNVLIQCKHQQKLDRPYNSAKAVQEIYSAKPHYEAETRKSFSTLLVVCNAVRFSSKVIEEVQKYDRVELHALKELNDLLQRHEVCRQQVQKRLQAERLNF